jgi:hypothetical protein
MAVLLRIVDNFYVNGPQGLFRPFETYAPLVVDTDAVLAIPLSDKRLKTVAGQRSKVLQRNRNLETVKLEARGPFDSKEGLD